MSKLSEYLVEAYEKGYRAHGDGKVISGSGRILKTRVASYGYITFAYKHRPIPVHRLIAYEKFGKDMLIKGIVVRHLDGNPLNNAWDNIDIGTQSDNMYDIPREDRLSHSHRASSFWLKHNHGDIYRMHQDGMSYKQIMTKLDITSKGTIAYIIKKERERQVV